MAEVRSIASLTISFGLVAIPVKLYSATISASRISFNLLHKKDGSRLKQQYVCAAEGKVVDRSEIVKGYEFAKDQYVQFTPEEIKALEEAGSSAIAVSEFVPLESVDPTYFDRTYYLAPDKGGAKPYTLFATALDSSKRCAIGRWASHGREHVVVLRPMGNGLAMHQLHFNTEVRSIRDLGIDKAPVTEAELKLARQIIDQQTVAAFDPSEFKDEVRERIEAEIQKKVEGREVTISNLAPAAAREDNVIDLMAALKASLRPGAAGNKRAAATERTRKPPKRVEKRPAAARKSSRA